MKTSTLQGYLFKDMGLLRLSGEKAGRLLHGQLTNSITTLLAGESNYNLFLNTKGKVIADAWVYRTHSDFLVLCEKIFLDKIKEQLGMLAPLSRVILTDETTLYFFLHLFSQNPSWDSWKNQGMIIPTNRLGHPSIDLIGAITHQKSILDSLKKNGFLPCSSEKAESLRIEAGIPRVGIDITEENLPQEGKLDFALHFTKGCYLGQEIIARLHYKGHVNKILCHFKIETPSHILQAGDPIFFEGKEVGKLTSVTASLSGSGFFALGYLPVKIKESGNPVTICDEIVRPLSS